jgi:transcriptional regulator with XRE-family HTH domain
LSDKNNNIVEKVLLKITDNVKKQRKLKKFSQLNLALEMGFSSAGLISFIEAGMNNKRYNLEHLIKISNILDIPICDLFDGVDEIIK